MTVRLSRSLRRAAVCVAAVALATGAVAAVPSSAYAAGPLPSTTSLVASSGTYVGDSITLTATVNVIVPVGLGVTPTGLVTFTATDENDNTYALGAAALGSCLLKTCTASISSADFVAGATSVLASYSGDTLAGASSATAGVYLQTPPIVAGPATPYEQVCDAGSACQTPSIYNRQSNPTEGATIAQPSSAAASTLTGYFESAPLPCSYTSGSLTPNRFVFNSTATDVGKTIEYYEFDDALADAHYQDYQNSVLTYGHVCLASPTPSRPTLRRHRPAAGLGPTPTTRTTGRLRTIRRSAPTSACCPPAPTWATWPRVTARSFFHVDGGHADYVYVKFNVPAGDPKVTN